MTALLVVIVLTLQTVGVFAAETYGSREEIPEKYKWKLTDIYPSNSDYEADLTKIEKVLIPKLLEYKGKLNDKAAVLGCLKVLTELKVTVDKTVGYAVSMLHLDMGNADSQKNIARFQSVEAKIDGAISFIDPELLRESEETILAYINDDDFSDYTNLLTTLLRKKSHILTESEEMLLSQMDALTNCPENIYSNLTNLDIKFDSIKAGDGKDIAVTSGRISLLLQGPDRVMRKAAFESLFGGYMSHINTLAAVLAVNVTMGNTFAEARNYDSVLEASLHNKNIPVSVYDNLISAANKNLESLHRYVRLRKSVLNVENVHSYDMYVPLVADYTFDLSYEDAKKLVMEGLRPLGSGYGDLLQKAFDENWIDVYETPGKQGGAYNRGLNTPHPLVLLNYSGSFNDVSTIAHELGHALNSYYTNNAQPYEKANNPIFVAEVASTVNEIIFTKYLIENAKTNEEKLFLINRLIDLYKNTFFTQIMYAEFEREIYKMASEGAALSAEELNELWRDLMVKYHGDAYVIDDLATAGWSRVSHFYDTFYVYQYATSIAASAAISKRILSKEPGALENYMEFLSPGSSCDPITTLKNAGQDMTTAQPINDFIEEFDSLVSEMEQLLKEVNTKKIDLTKKP